MNLLSLSFLVTDVTQENDANREVHGEEWKPVLWQVGCWVCCGRGREASGGPICGRGVNGSGRPDTDDTQQEERGEDVGFDKIVVYCTCD